MKITAECQQYIGVPFYQRELVIGLDMELIAAPARQFKTWSFWITNLIIAAGFIGAMTNAFIKWIPPDIAFALVGATAAIGQLAKFIKQNIEVTTQQKVDLIQAADKVPVKEGQADVMAIVKEEFIGS